MGEDWFNPTLAQVLTKMTKKTQKTQKTMGVKVTFPKEKSSTGTVCVKAPDTSCEYNALEGKVIYFESNDTLCAMSTGEDYGKPWNSSAEADCVKGGVPPAEEEEEDWFNPTLAQVLTKMAKKTKKTQKTMGVKVTFPKEKSSTGTVCVKAPDTSCEYNALEGKVI